MSFLSSLMCIRREIKYYTLFHHRIRKIHNKGKYVYFCVNSAVHGNLGDQALSFCRFEYLEKIGVPQDQIVELSTRDEMRFWPQIKRSVKEQDVILLRGGGSWGDLWLDGFDSILSWIESFPNNKIIVFPQSAYFSDTEVGVSIKNKSKQLIDRAKKLTVFARDKSSFLLLKQLYPNADIRVTPDTVLSYRPDISNSINRDGIILCLRNDKEKNPDSLKKDKLIDLLVESKNNIICQDTSIQVNLRHLKQRIVLLNNIWNKFSSAKFVVTDRLHGMIFSIITGTPCVIFDNIDGKVGHQFEWVKDLGYAFFVNNYVTVEELYDLVNGIKPSEYPIENMIPLFDDLKNCILDN